MALRPAWLWRLVSPTSFHFSHLVLEVILDLQKSIESLDKSSQSSISS